ncbi:hypothetical protein NPIL_63821 [Nephila pilipes]|uniref:Uncharacterized protein n=1 Tax=Nephila pilipes TaxID=299642 RepID=A0A8X6MHU6_NEPPI|nr:hypothetical protein NPIL_63821 [Nephila pilipes]
MIIVEKKGNLRLCLDPRDLSKVIKREHYQIPCTDDIISRLEGIKPDPDHIKAIVEGQPQNQKLKLGDYWAW